MPDLKTNVLYYGDNLGILRNRDYFPDESVDLIYLDPPFNSKADYNVLFKEPTGELSAAQIKVFTDTWHWDLSAERTFEEIVNDGPPQVARMASALREFIGSNDVMAYLVMMTIRLIELHRVLKPAGSMFLHCDPTAGHYLKIVMDTIFGKDSFQNQIVWHYRGGGVSPRRFGRRHDMIFFYTKGAKWAFNVDAVRQAYSVDTLERARYKARSFRGEKVYDTWEPHPLGKHPDDVWDLQPIMPSSKERLSYPTQKPLALLERIVLAASNEGDVVLDPFCGCGTAVVAAQRLNRLWIGIDITHLAITVMKNRLADSFGLQASKDYQVIGEPVDASSASALKEQDPYQFQWWALSLVGGKPVGDDKKKGADKGIDGAISFMDQGGKAKWVIVQVKSGHVSPAHIRDLKGTMERENAEIGVFITLEPPTPAMKTEAAMAGFYHSQLWDKDYPRVQILTIEQLLGGKQPELPGWASAGFPRAEKIQKGVAKQTDMPL